MLEGRSHLTEARQHRSASSRSGHPTGRKGRCPSVLPAGRLHLGASFRPVSSIGSRAVQVHRPGSVPAGPHGAKQIILPDRILGALNPTPAGHDHVGVEPCPYRAVPSGGESFVPSHCFVQSGVGVPVGGPYRPGSSKSGAWRRRTTWWSSRFRPDTVLAEQGPRQAGPAAHQGVLQT